jgi:hypothetical protein
VIEWSCEMCGWILEVPQACPLCLSGFLMALFTTILTRRIFRQ